MFDFEPDNGISVLNAPRITTKDFANPNCPTCGKFTKYYLSSKHGRVLGCKSCGKSYKHKGETNKPKNELGSAKVNEAKSEKPEGTTKKGLEASPKKDFSTDSDGYAPARGGKGNDWVTHDDYDENTPAEKEKRGGIYFQNKPRLAGYYARHWGMERKENPFKKEDDKHKDWHEGWDDHEYIHGDKTEKSESKDFSGYTPGSLFKMPKYDGHFELKKIIGDKAMLSHPTKGPASISLANLSKMTQVSPVIPQTPKPLPDHGQAGEHLATLSDYGADFAQDIGDTFDSIHAKDSPLGKRSEASKKNAEKYESNPIFKKNVDSIHRAMSKVGAWMADKDAPERVRNAGTIHEHLKQLVDATGKHSSAIQHAYALTNPTEMEGKYGYPESASEAIQRHVGRLHNDYHVADHPNRDVPPLEESTIIPPFAQDVVADRSDLKKNLDRISKMENHKGPFIRHLIDRMPEHFPQPNNGYMTQTERLEKLRSGELDPQKMDRLLEAMHGEHGSVTRDQLYNHVLPNLPFKIPSETPEDNRNTRYGSLTPKIKAEMLRSDKMKKILDEQNAERAANPPATPMIPATTAKTPKAAGRASMEPTPGSIGLNAKNVKPVAGKEILDRLRPELSPGTRFKMGDNVYTSVAGAHFAVDKNGEPYMAFRRTNRDLNEDALREKRRNIEDRMHKISNLSPEYKELQEELGRINIGKDIKVPLKDLEHFVHTYKVS